MSRSSEFGGQETKVELPTTFTIPDFRAKVGPSTCDRSSEFGDRESKVEASIMLRLPKFKGGPPVNEGASDGADLNGGSDRTMEIRPRATKERRSS